MARFRRSSTTLPETGVEKQEEPGSPYSRQSPQGPRPKMARLEAFIIDQPPPTMDSATERSYLAGICIMSLVLVYGAVECFVRFVMDPALKRSDEELAAVTEPSSLALTSAVAPLSARGLEPTWTGTETSPTYQLTTHEFAEMQCLLAWFTCVFTGLGSEFFMGYEMMLTVETVTSKHEHMWFVAQFLFPIMIYSAILLAKEQNALALVLGCVGMWKFGFPETLSYFMHAQQPKGLIHFLANLLNALGTLTHHSTSMLFICIFTTGLAPMTRPLIAGSTPLVVQHLFVSLKYFSMPLYAISELLLEIFWEWEVIAGIELMYLPHGMPLSAEHTHPTTSGLAIRCLTAMLLAHWFYWSAAILDTIGMAMGCPGYESDSGGTGDWRGGAVAEFQQNVSTFHEKRNDSFNRSDSNQKEPSPAHRDGASRTTSSRISSP